MTDETKSTILLFIDEQISMEFFEIAYKVEIKSILVFSWHNRILLLLEKAETKIVYLSLQLMLVITLCAKLCKSMISL